MFTKGEQGMILSNSNTVRFITLYKRGFTLPFSQIILGHGYRGNGGRNHETLVERYNIITKDQHIYAGYLCVDGEKVKVFSGGSETLRIKDREDLNRNIEEQLNTPRFKNYITHLFPLLTSNTIPDLVLGD
jgi:hypothetical protein